MLNRILVPLDGSPAMAQIVPALRHLVGGTGAEVQLLAVRPPVRDLVRRGDRVLHLDEQLREERATWSDYLQRLGSQLAYDGVVVRREVRFGEPLIETLAAAQRHAAHLVAVAARSQDALQRVLRPSLAQQLLTQSTIPVLAIPCWPPLQGSGALRYRSVPV